MSSERLGPADRDAPRTETDVFISYRHTDAAVARLLAQGLERRGLRVWIDETHIRPGEHWQDAVAEGVLAARACVVVIGETGVDRVQAEEVRLALGRSYDDPDLPVIPVVLDGARRSAAVDPFLRTRSELRIPPAGIDDALRPAQRRGPRPRRRRWGQAGGDPGQESVPGPPRCFGRAMPPTSSGGPERSVSWSPWSPSPGSSLWSDRAEPASPPSSTPGSSIS